jgi:anti-anti-sigma regulatory factor
MRLKIDTKEKFTVITPEVDHLTANMADECSETLLAYLQKDIPHIVIKMDMVKTIDETMAFSLARVQEAFYEKNCSCVICGLTPAAEKKLDELEILEVLNVTPTESEAWDIVQMEEIERELLDDGEQ